jgi:heme-degrading monooxygenase HmoA
MPYILVRHKVNDYAKWKPLFDAHEGRKAAGSQGGRIFRTAEDPNELVVLMEWDTLDKARAFAHSDDLRKTMEKAGVADQPDVYFLEEIETFDA